MPLYTVFGRSCVYLNINYCSTVFVWCLKKGIRKMELYDVFISYRRTDGSDYANALYAFLKKKKIKVYLDVEKMERGHAFPEQLREAIKIATHYILIATPKAFEFHENLETGEKDYVLEEMRTACEVFESDPKKHTIHVLKDPKTKAKEEIIFPKDISALGVQKWHQLNIDGNNESLFLKLLTNITAITPNNVWDAAKRWFNNSRSPEGRFPHLNINKAIFPNARKNDMEEQFPVSIFQKDESNSALEIQPLFDALKGFHDSVILVGEGGIGKTTALMRIMEEYYGDGTKEIIRIPIFVELSCAPDSYGELYENGVSSYIRRAVFRQINDNRKAQHGIGVQSQEIDEAFSLPAAVSVDPVDNLFSNQAKSPHFLLLLDGLNEVSLSVLNETGLSIYWMIVKEIEYLLYNCPNVQLVVTTRSECEFSLNEKLTRFYLTGVNQETVKSFLTDAGMPKDSIENALNDKELSEVLRVPLFLTIYSTLKHYNKVTTRGEILRQFFHEQGDCIEDYTVKARVNKIEKDIVRSSGIKQKNRITATMQTFILDFILPKIAWYMEKESKYHITENMASVFIEHVLTDFSDGAICGIYGKQLFSQYKGMFAHENVRETANSFQKLGENVAGVTVSIMDCCAFSLGILKKSEQGFFFIHQYFRDFFCAVNNINIMRLSSYMFEKQEKNGALNCLLEVFKDKPISFTVRRFIGEYLGEHKNKPYFSDGKWIYAVPIDKSDRNLLDRVLDLFRGRFGTQEIDGCALFSLVQILKEIREDLSGICFSNLDLTRLNLNGVTFSRYGLITNFDFAKINRDNLMRTGHNKEITSVCFSPKGDTILTSSKDGVAIIWDIETCSEIATLYGHKGEIRFASFSSDGKFILTQSFDLSYNQCVKIWDATRYMEIGTYSPDSGLVSTVCFSPDSSKLLITSFEENVIIWDIKNSRIDSVIRGKNQTITRAEYVLNGNIILTISNEGILTLWDANTYVQIKQRDLSIEGKPDLVPSADTSSYFVNHVLDIEEKEMIGLIDNVVTESISRKPYVKTANSVLAISYGEEIELWDCLLQEKKGLINGNLRNACFSSDGQKIAIASSDDSIEIWDISSCNKMISLSGHSNTITSLSFNTCGNLLLTTSWDGTAKIWEIKSGREIGVLSDRNKDWVTLGCFSPDGKKIITVSDGEGATKLWDLVAFNEIGSFRQSFHHSQFGCYAQNCNRYAISLSDSDSEAIVCNSINNKVENVLIGHKNRINSICFCSDNKKVATASDDGAVKIWDVKSGLELGHLVGHKDDVIDISFNLNGDKLISSSRDGTAKIWDMRTMREIRSFAEKDSYFVNQILSARFSPDDKMVVTISYNHKAKIWATESGDMLCTLNVEQTGGVDLTPCASFDPYGKMILTTCGKIAYIWDARTKQLLKRFPHSSDIKWACFSPDGGKILTISYKSVFIWSIQIGFPIAIITCEDDDSLFTHADYRPDGKRIMTTQYNDIVKIWSTSTYECLHSIKLVSGLRIVGCDFRNLHPRSHFTQKDKEILRYYGVFID